MSRYRRANTAGATYFFTVVTIGGAVFCATRMFALRWQQIKRFVTLRCGERLHKAEWMTHSKTNHRESTLWQRRYWEYQTRDGVDYERHMDYLHYNPVKHRLVTKVKDWLYSSFHRHLMSGTYIEHWATTSIFDQDNFGDVV